MSISLVGIVVGAVSIWIIGVVMSISVCSGYIGKDLPDDTFVAVTVCWPIFLSLWLLALPLAGIQLCVKRLGGGE